MAADDAAGLSYSRTAGVAFVFNGASGRYNKIKCGQSGHLLMSHKKEQGLPCVTFMRLLVKQ